MALPHRYSHAADRIDVRPAFLLARTWRSETWCGSGIQSDGAPGAGGQVIPSRARTFHGCALRMSSISGDSQEAARTRPWTREGRGAASGSRSVTRCKATSGRLTPSRPPGRGEGVPKARPLRFYLKRNAPARPRACLIVSTHQLPTVVMRPWIPTGQSGPRPSSLPGRCVPLRVPGPVRRGR